MSEIAGYFNKFIADYESGNITIELCDEEEKALISLIRIHDPEFDGFPLPKEELKKTLIKYWMAEEMSR